MNDNERERLEKFSEIQSAQIKKGEEKAKEVLERLRDANLPAGVLAQIQGAIAVDPYAKISIEGTNITIETHTKSYGLSSQSGFYELPLDFQVNGPFYLDQRGENNHKFTISKHDDGTLVVMNENISSSYDWDFAQGKPTKDKGVIRCSKTETKYDSIKHKKIEEHEVYFTPIELSTNLENYLTNYRDNIFKTEKVNNITDIVNSFSGDYTSGVTTDTMYLEDNIAQFCSHLYHPGQFKGGETIIFTTTTENNVDYLGNNAVNLGRQAEEIRKNEPEVWQYLEGNTIEEKMQFYLNNKTGKSL